MDLKDLVESGAHKELYWALYRVRQGVAFSSPVASYSASIRELYAILGSLRVDGSKLDLGPLDRVMLSGISAWLCDLARPLEDPRLQFLSYCISLSL